MMPRLLRSVLIVAIVSFLVGLAWMGMFARQHSVTQAAQTTTKIGIDTDPSGNSATSLGDIQSCVSVSSGDTFQVDIFVVDVSDLLAWELYIAYDRSVLEIVGRDVGMFQAADGASKVFDASEALPDLDALYGLAAADLAEPEMPDSGSGVLASLTLEAVRSGLSPVTIAFVDANKDGTIDIGPWLRDVDANLIDDVNGDSFFDGTIFNAQIAVDQPCPEGTPGSTLTPIPPPTETPTVAETAPPAATETVPAVSTGTATATPEASPGAMATPSGEPGEESENQGGIPWALVGPLIGVGAVVVLAGGFILWRVVRQRAG